MAFNISLIMHNSISHNYILSFETFFNESQYIYIYIYVAPIDIYLYIMKNLNILSGPLTLQAARRSLQGVVFHILHVLQPLHALQSTAFNKDNFQHL